MTSAAIQASFAASTSLRTTRSKLLPEVCCFSTSFHVSPRVSEGRHPNFLSRSGAQYVEENQQEFSNIR